MHRRRLQRGAWPDLLYGRGWERALPFPASEAGAIAVELFGKFPPLSGIQEIPFHSVDRSRLPLRKSVAEGLRLVRSVGQKSLFLRGERCRGKTPQRCGTGNAALMVVMQVFK